MKIEIAEPGRMTQTGSSLLKLIQNNNMPILDLLVRESIQNSLDAQNEKDPFVMVEFYTGKFRKSLLNKELEGITDSLNRKYWENDYKFIAVRDSNTVGLTGKLHYDEVKDNQYGNCLKLIYEISKPQEAEGAGGSWGLGKTVYFRVGIGLVIYYSRIINEDGEFESRLAASLVENEIDEESLIPTIPGKSKRGIAWWGQEIGDNKTKPNTDEQYIEQILSVFGLEPYKGKLTGTTIIIPYIDEQKLLESNQIEYTDGEDNSICPFWRNSVEAYLKIAIQRWYAPRLDNTNYSYGKFLRAKINQKEITIESMEPTFQIVQALYNKAISKDSLTDILLNEGVECKVENIVLRKVLETTKAGTIAYTKVPRKILKTQYPDNKPEPYMYFNCEMRDKEKNKPMLFFTRKPGMIVSYEDVGNWVDNISSSNKDEFIFAIFVLNSENKLTGTTGVYSLEEYIRKSEMADHTSWRDFSIGNVNPRIVSKVQGQVNSKISKEFSVEEDDVTSRLNSGFGKLFGDMLLPPENFGRKPSSGLNSGSISGGQHIERYKNIVLKYDPTKTRYLATGMIVKLYVRSKGKIKGFGINLEIDSEMGAIRPVEWEDKMGLSMPFEITESEIIVKRIDSEVKALTMVLDSNSINSKVDDITCILNKTKNNAGSSIYILADAEHELEIEMDITLKLNRRDIKPLFNIEKNERNK